MSFVFHDLIFVFSHPRKKGVCDPRWTEAGAKPALPRNCVRNEIPLRGHWWYKAAGKAGRVGFLSRKSGYVHRG